MPDRHSNRHRQKDPEGEKSIQEGQLLTRQRCADLALGIGDAGHDYLDAAAAIGSIEVGKGAPCRVANFPGATACLRKPSLIGLHGAFFSEPRKRLLKNLCRSYIWGHHYPVVHPFSFSASCYNSGITQVGQMPGYLGLRLIQNLDEIADADFLIPHEIQEPQPRIVAESLKEALHVESSCPWPS